MSGYFHLFNHSALFEDPLCARLDIKGKIWLASPCYRAHNLLGERETPDTDHDEENSGATRALAYLILPNAFWGNTCDIPTL